MSVHDASLLQLPHFQDDRGALSFVEGERHVPFSIRRVYYLYDVQAGESRGGHAHKQLQQLMIPLAGAFTVELDDGVEKRSFRLERPSQGLYVPRGLWRDLREFTPGAVCLVLASLPYSEEDYYRDYDEYLSAVREKA